MCPCGHENLLSICHRWIQAFSIRKASRQGQASGGKKKKKHRNNQQTTVPSDDNQRENIKGRGTKCEENLGSATGGIDKSEGNALFPNIDSSFTETQRKEKTAAEPLRERELPPMSQNVTINGDLPYQETSKKHPVNANNKSVARVSIVRPSSGFHHIASSMDVLPSKKATTSARSSNGLLCKS